MALDTIGETIPQTTTLFRPVPVNKLQRNLAYFYERTSKFVEEQFKELMESSLPENRKTSDNPSGTSEESSRIKPQGLGTLFDIYA